MLITDLQSYASAPYIDYARVTRYTLSIIIFLIASNYTWRQWACPFRSPRLLLLGIAINLVVFPVVAFYTASSSPENSSSAAAICLISVLPPFLTPVLFTYIARGKVPDAFWISFFSGFLFLFLFNNYKSAFSLAMPSLSSYITPATIDPAVVLVDLFLHSLLPALLGLAAGRLLPKRVVERFAGPLTYAAASVLTCTIVVIIVEYRVFLTDTFSESGLLTLSAFLVSMAVAYGASIIFHSTTMKDAATISLVSTTKHGAMATAVIASSLPEGSLLPASLFWWVVIQYSLGIVIAYCFRPLTNNRVGSLSGTTAA